MSATKSHEDHKAVRPAQPGWSTALSRYDGFLALLSLGPVLLRQDVLRGIEDGRIQAVFRRWARARVNPGTRLRTAVGIVEVVSVDEIDPDSLTTDDAVAAGLESVPDLISAAGDRGPVLYRIGVRHAGPDPRAVLRDTIPDEAELAAVLRRLDRLDASSRHGPWTRETLALVASNPEVRAEDLARTVGREKAPFKLDVRKLKELGLTESLERGYRLSRRGQEVLRFWSGQGLP